MGNGTPWVAAYNALTNQVSNGLVKGGYDANGNQLSSTGLSQVTWTAGSLPASVTDLNNATHTAVYDALGRAVESNATAAKTLFLYGASGAKVAKLVGGTLIAAMVPLTGGETAVYNASGLQYLRHTDWLGSSRLATTWAHAVYSKESYAPFGETYNEFGTADRSFTGQEQDTVTGSGATGTYDFPARSYDPAAGRWLSPDPLGWGAASAVDPQSLNRYAYVENQPLSAVDPTGMYLCMSNAVSSDGYYYAYDSGDQPCGSGYSIYQAPTETVKVSASDPPKPPDPDSCSDTNPSACAPSTLGGPSKPKGSGGSNNGSGGGGGECDNACQLAHALNKTGVYGLTSPCAPAGFYAASAVAAVGPGVAASGSYYEAGYALGVATRIEGYIEGGINTFNKWTGMNIPTPASLSAKAVKACTAQ